MKKVITREEWEKRLSSVKPKKEDMNKLVMNFLVTEGFVEVAEIFQIETGTERIHMNIYELTFFVRLFRRIFVCYVIYGY